MSRAPTPVRIPALMLALLLGGAAPGLADDAGSVAVTLAAPVHGAVPVVVTAYGTLVAGAGAATTLSLPIGVTVRIRVSVGQSVHRGDPLLEVTPTADAISARTQAQAAVTLARANLTHAQALLARQLATRDQLAQAQNALTVAVAAARAQASATGPLRAPADGVVSALPVADGAIAAAGSPLLVLTQSRGLVAELGVEPADQPRLRAGQTARVAALDGSASGSVDEPVLEVASLVDPDSRLVPVRTTAPPGWLAGSAVVAEIAVGSAQGWIMARDAVLDDDRGSYLFQVAGGHARRIAARRLAFAGDRVVVAAALDPALPIVMTGNYQLADGARVRTGP